MFDSGNEKAPRFDIRLIDSITKVDGTNNIGKNSWHDVTKTIGMMVIRADPLSEHKNIQPKKEKKQKQERAITRAFIIRFRALLFLGRLSRRSYLYHSKSKVLSNK